jgi:hypothetical protein
MNYEEMLKTEKKYTKEMITEGWWFEEISQEYVKCPIGGDFIRPPQVWVLHRSRWPIKHNTISVVIE